MNTLMPGARKTTDMEHNTVKLSDPLERGFMRSGFFAWPARGKKCVQCGAVFNAYTGNVLRCFQCRPVYRKQWRKNRRKERVKK